MGRRRTVSVGVISIFGFLSAVTAGTYDHSGFSFLTGETSNYSLLSSYYANHQLGQAPASYQAAAAAPPAAQPVVRKNRGIGHSHTTTYFTSPTIYLNKAPLYYPESSVFSDPLPIVPLPQLPSEFLTLKTAQFSNADAYTGSENEVPKKSKKGRRGKNAMPTPAPVEEDEEEDDAQETEADSAQGGYESMRPPMSRQREQGRSRSRQREQGATGGYSGTSDANIGSNVGASSGQASEGATGGYSSSSDANGEPPKATSGSRKRFRSRGRGNKNEEDDQDTIEETEGEENDEFMMTSDDADDNTAEPEVDDDTRDEEDEQEEVPMKGRSRNQGSRGRKNNGRAKGRGEDEESDLNAVLSQEGQKLGTFFVPTFGNNVLNTVFPAYSQNTLLKSLEGQIGLVEQSYPGSGQDVSAISIASDGKKSRKSKKRTSARKNRPASRGRSSSRRSKNRPASNEPNSQQNQGGYSNPPQQGQGSQEQSQISPPSQQNQGSQGQSQQYGPPAQQSQGGSGGSQQYGPPPQQSQGGSGSSQQYGPPPQQNQGNQQYGPPHFTPGNPSSQYGAPSAQQGQGINPPLQSGSGYSTIGNAFRARTNEYPQQRQPILEPRQLSQVVSGGNDQFPVAESNNPVTADLLRTVQAILQRYPN